jgi:hypothetical protein
MFAQDAAPTRTKQKQVGGDGMNGSFILSDPIEWIPFWFFLERDDEA